jgi:mRNA-degrading endonuclease RelE of RelBE toxin-antitoxin system
MNTIIWTTKAARQLRKIAEKTAQKRIYAETQTLAEFPNCANLKKLTNADYPYRLRIGDWRVFFTFNGAVSIISIEEVKKRNERTY